MEDGSGVDCSFEKQPFERNYGLAATTAGVEISSISRRLQVLHVEKTASNPL
jgi:hypothetical protein